MTVEEVVKVIRDVGEELKKAIAKLPFKHTKE